MNLRNHDNLKLGRCYLATKWSGEEAKRYQSIVSLATRYALPV